MKALGGLSAADIFDYGLSAIEAIKANDEGANVVAIRFALAKLSK